MPVLDDSLGNRAAADTLTRVIPRRKPRGLTITAILDGGESISLHNTAVQGAKIKCKNETRY